MIVIYGTGKYGDKLYNLLKWMGLRTDYFAQTKRDELYHKNVKVLSREELIEKSANAIVLIAIADEIISGTICTDLKTEKTDWRCVLICGKFIDDNTSFKLFDGIVNGEKSYCPFCNKTVPGFLPLEKKGEIFRKYHVIGGNGRDRCFCYYCGGKDRERWLHYVLEKYTDIYTGRCSVLHFAPERNVAALIKKNPNAYYFSGDLIRGVADNVIDVTDIPFKDEFFDYIIINHVMCYVKDEEKAFSELRRVLKKEGKLIISFTINTELKTYEKIEDEEGMDLFGDPYKVRMYGTDYLNHLRENGFDAKIFSPNEEVSEEMIGYYSYIKDDVLMICEKA